MSSIQVLWNVCTSVNQNNGDIDLKGNSSTQFNTRYLGGIRWTSRVVPKIKLMGSALYQNWNAGSSLWVLGADIASDYSLVDITILKNFRLGLGGAIALADDCRSTPHFAPARLSIPNRSQT